MADFTHDCPVLKDATLSHELREDLRELREAFPDQRVEPRRWNSNYVAIPLVVPVNRPTRGPVDGIDVRAQEPIFILAHTRAYGWRAPSARSDRRDFPALPHLNPVAPGEAASFCLHRGNADDWFVERTLLGFVERVQQWLSDAASGLLMREGDTFEPTRIEESSGYALYDPDSLDRDVQAGAHAGPGHAYLQYALLPSPAADPLIAGAAYAIRHQGTLDLAAATRLREQQDAARKADRDSADAAPNRGARVLLGILVWPPRGTVHTDYFATLPRTLGSLLAWADARGFRLETALEEYGAHKLHLLGAVPLTLAVPRGRRVHGTSLNTEFLNLLLGGDIDQWMSDGKWDPETPVRILSHKKPLTRKLARQLSARPVEEKELRILLLGAGALGSKLGLHLARRGQARQTVVDDDTLAPHNLVRHALPPQALGRNKADALAEVIDEMYVNDEGRVAEAVRASAVDHLTTSSRERLAAFDLVVDATAAPNVREVLLHAPLGAARVVRCEATDEGRLGILAREGPGRNPRLDDLQATLFDHAMEDDRIAAWLDDNRKARSEALGSRAEGIHLGISCSSDTLPVGDDLVSYHAALMALHLDTHPSAAKPEGQEDGGLLLLSWIDAAGIRGPLSSAERIQVGPVTVRKAANDRAWQLRIPHRLVDEMHERLKERAPKETGGILVGYAHRKRRTIHVTRILHEPPDSQASPGGFTRGIRDLPEEVRRIEARTGGLLGYVGEWHTHPLGGERLSRIDKNAVASLRSYLKPVGLPTHVMVVTPTDFAAYVFE